MSQAAPADPSPSRQEFEHARRAFAEARTRLGGAETRFSVAGVGFEVQFAGDALHDRISAPFRHLPGFAGEPSLRVMVWDTQSTGVPEPIAVSRRYALHASSGPGAVDSDGILAALARPDPGLTMFDAASGEAIYWVPSPNLTYGDIAGAFRAVFTWGMAARGLQFLHSAAVAWKSRAALIVGASGSGKSSTALACLLAGMEYLGDDHCLLDLRAAPQVHSLYAAAKLLDAQLERFPELDPYIVNRERVAPEKGVAILFPGFANQLPPSRPLVAVLVPKIVGGRTTSIRQIGAAAALAALAPSTLLQMAAADRGAMAAMAKLVRTVPCYALELGTERDEIAAAVRDFLSPEGRGVPGS